MATREQLTSDELKLLFRYDSETGKLYWLPRPRIWFANQRVFALWTSKYANKEALNGTDKDGYLFGRVFGQDYRAHRVAFCMFHGYWPERIDHEDGNKQNNLIANLCASDPVHNARNMFRSRANITGVTGVHWDRLRGKWVARIMVNYKEKFLGYFNSFEEAAERRLSAEKEYGFSPRHGETRR